MTLFSLTNLVRSSSWSLCLVLAAGCTLGPKAGGEGDTSSASGESEGGATAAPQTADPSPGSGGPSLVTGSYSAMICPE